MNQFFYESRGREKVKDLMNEGMQSQAYSRLGTSKINLLSRLPKLILVVLAIVWVIQLTV